MRHIFILPLNRLKVMSDDSASFDRIPSVQPRPAIKSNTRDVFWEVVLLASVIKLCFIYTYRSSDFEVHRNWLAITYSLPLGKWYYDTTSEWTLDYPPFFAWFEYLLSNLAVHLDPGIVKVSNLNYASNGCILFQRLSVILSDFVLAYGLKKCCAYLKNHRSRKCSHWKYKWRSPTAVLQLLVLFNVGLLIVDHIHFQYNGFLLGILLLSIAEVLEGRFLWSAFWYAVLLNLKHIYLYIAPVYFVFFLRNYCFNSTGKRVIWRNFSMKRLLKLGCIVIGVTLISFGPFIYLGQLSQVFSRLFPFKRGLTHAYWAPNIWTLYNLLDKLLVIAFRLAGFKINVPPGSMTGGLVQEYRHAILPSVGPLFTFICTIASAFPCLWKLWRSPAMPLHFVRAIVVCSGCAFLFGWHVHEKAILMTLVPLSLTSVLYNREAKFFVLLSAIGHYSLLPLLFTFPEFYLKFLLYLFYVLYTFLACSDLLGRDRHPYSFPFLSVSETIYILGFFFVCLYELVIQYVLGFNIRFPFLNLMLVSSYCAVGILYTFINYYRYFLFYDSFKYKSF